ncbi:YciI family protein [Variovorax sp. J22G21]|uniref:YciI family protein n=1 Tax=Variovorax fucosicus TaxID=3053517 RepID=UPI00257892FC|nr:MULTISPECIES: YciI family protein [unclassified Variovorax]MDM0042267.1 YciI family protein [Variovorax sp. J22R193]MDM0059428.1 YciI family protein [Variovorax sp. J22G47]MDM0060871.1 YciI family protein [Variovorax sp. J22G21]
MQYMLMFYVTPDDLAKYGDERADAHKASWMAYVGAISQSGITLSGEGLLPPSTATSLRVRGDKRQVQDGPFADTKEQLGGYFIIEVPHLDAALEWAARAPCASTGGVEVRPVMPRESM